MRVDARTFEDLQATNAQIVEMYTADVSLVPRDVAKRLRVSEAHVRGVLDRKGVLRKRKVVARG